MHIRLAKTRRLTWRLLVPMVGLAAAGQLALTGVASATHVQVASRGKAPATHYAVNWKLPNMLDCNSWGEHAGRDVRSSRPAMKALCTDPVHIHNGVINRFIDNGWYVGHDEPSVKFISSAPGSGNTMSYGMQLPVDPAKAPTATGSVTKYGELSVAPWFGLPMCDPHSYPQRPCTPLSDSNIGSSGSKSAAGSAFMELQFYPPGFTPFTDSPSCSTTKWCAALTIDSLECTFNFKSCNNSCIEPVNFAFLQTDGVPAGPPAPQQADLATFTPNGNTLEMGPGDVLKVSISDVPDSVSSPDTGGFKAEVTDVTTNTSGYIVASAANGFANTSRRDCSGTPFSFHAEYSSARKQNQVPWAALEGGVLMQQEIGHFETCNSLVGKMGFGEQFPDNSTYLDPQVFQTCKGGSEGKPTKRGEGPCNLRTFKHCKGASTQGRRHPVACPTTNANVGSVHCEFADGFCMHRGSRPVTINGAGSTESWAVTGCTQNFAQNGDLDFDGTSYRRDWPNGGSNFPTSVAYVGPFTNGQTYPSIQFETDVAGSEQLCHLNRKKSNFGKGCTAPPIGAKFYPFWSLNNSQVLTGLTSSPGVCVWNFGNDISGVTKSDFSRDKQYGKPDKARFAGTLTSAVRSNPALGSSCTSFSF